MMRDAAMAFDQGRQALQRQVQKQHDIAKSLGYRSPQHLVDSAHASAMSLATRNAQVATAIASVMDRAERVDRTQPSPIAFPAVSSHDPGESSNAPRTRRQERRALKN
jgi:hypothetical protein